jgi:GAF domain-containing protein
MNQLRSGSSSSLPPDAHLAAAARMIDRSLRTAVPSLCDFGLVHVAIDQAIVGVGAAHRRPEGLRLVRELLRIHRLRASDSFSTVAHVIRTRQPLLRSDIPAEPVTSERRVDRVAQLHRMLAPRSALVLPIVVRDSVLGAVSLCYSDSGRRYRQADVGSGARLALQVGYILMMAALPHADARLHTATGHARQGTTVRRRVAPRN